jgi:hypothetical protein
VLDGPLSWPWLSMAKTWKKYEVLGLKPLIVALGREAPAFPLAEPVERPKKATVAGGSPINGPPKDRDARTR